MTEEMSVDNPVGVNIAGKKRLLENDNAEDKVEEPPAKKRKLEKKEAKEVTEGMLKELASQVDFYFGNSNLPFDEWMLNKLKENDGWLYVNELMNFNQVKKKSKENRDAVIQSFKLSEVVEFDPEQERVRRKESLGPLPTKEDVMERSIFAMGFPREYVRRRHIQSFFEAQGIRVNAVWPIFNPIKFRHRMEKHFMGDAYIEFESAETAKELAGKELDFEGKKIHTGMRQDYDVMCHKHENLWQDQLPPFEDDRVLHFKNLPPQTIHYHIKSLLNATVPKLAEKKAESGQDNEEKAEKLDADQNGGATEATESEDAQMMTPEENQRALEEAYGGGGRSFHEVTNFVRVEGSSAYCRTSFSAKAVCELLKGKAINGVPLEVEPCEPQLARQKWQKLTYVKSKMDATRQHRYKKGRGKGKKRRNWKRNGRGGDDRNDENGNPNQNETAPVADGGSQENSHEDDRRGKKRRLDDEATEKNAPSPKKARTEDNQQKDGEKV